VQLVVLPLALLGLWALARAAGKVLLIFIVAAVIALILNPAVAFLQRSRLPRGLAVLAVYLAFFLTLTGIGVLLANPISNQVRTFTHNLPTLRNEANNGPRRFSANWTSRASIFTSSNKGRPRCRASKRKSPRARANSSRSAERC
jgi:predicted PurR-regulated permease PerM